MNDLSETAEGGLNLTGPHANTKTLSSFPGLERQNVVAGDGSKGGAHARRTERRQRGGAGR